MTLILSQEAHLYLCLGGQESPASRIWEDCHAEWRTRKSAVNNLYCTDNRQYYWISSAYKAWPQIHTTGNTLFTRYPVSIRVSLFDVALGTCLCALDRLVTGSDFGSRTCSVATHG